MRISSAVVHVDRCCLAGCKLLAESDDGRFAGEQYVYHSSPHPSGVSHSFEMRSDASSIEF
jgi:hypothetical protein